MIAGLAFRPIGPEDESLLLDLYASTRQDEMAAVPWTDEQKRVFIHMQFTAQRDHYKAHYPHAIQQVILHGEQPAGRLWIDWQADRIHILDLTVLPAHRNGGLGTAILRQLQTEAAESGRAVTIFVESYNPSVRLFERLGFKAAEVTGFHVLFQWRREEEV
ncbi:MAG TPA: GNAT family N-acetyltransferase [Symbiobacteriaceae bacterium]|nr:GNAT family N-acetyltransferase [Symbiobacteriaceae bacterium]